MHARLSGRFRSRDGLLLHRRSMSKGSRSWHEIRHGEPDTALQERTSRKTRPGHDFLLACVVFVHLFVGWSGEASLAVSKSKPRCHAAQNAENGQRKSFCCLLGAGNTQTFNRSFARGKTQKTSRNAGLLRARPLPPERVRMTWYNQCVQLPGQPRLCRGRCLNTSYVERYHSATLFKGAHILR